MADKIDVSTEAASTNFYWTYGNEEVFNLQTTVRGMLDSEQVEAHLRAVQNMMYAIVKHGGHAKQVGQATYSKTIVAPTPEHTPVQEMAYGDPTAPAAGALVFDVESISVRTEDDKTYYKVKGGNFVQYGVTVWPEVFKAAGLDPSAVHALGAGWKAEYVTKTNDKGEVKPDKVVRLFR